MDNYDEAHQQIDDGLRRLKEGIAQMFGIDLGKLEAAPVPNHERDVIAKLADGQSLLDAALNYHDTAPVPDDTMQAAFNIMLKNLVANNIISLAMAPVIGDLMWFTISMHDYHKAQVAPERAALESLLSDVRVDL